MITYRINRWEDIYENNRSRTVKDLRWVAVPNTFDGEKYSELMTDTKAAVLFSAWILLLEVASRCHPRGSLVRADGTPHDSRSLSLKTRAPQSWFDLALPYFTASRWLIREATEEEQFAHPGTQTDNGLTGDRHPPAKNTSDKEGEGKEGKEGMEENGKEGSIAPSSGDLGADAPPPLQEKSPDDLKLELAVAKIQPLLVFPCVGSERTWDLMPAHVNELQTTYPGIDVMQEAREAWQWCRDNPTKRKTAGGMRKFISRWMKRAQNDLPVNSQGQRNKPTRRKGVYENAFLGEDEHA